MLTFDTVETLYRYRLTYDTVETLYRYRSTYDTVETLYRYRSTYNTVRCKFSQKILQKLYQKDSSPSLKKTLKLINNAPSYADVAAGH